MTAALIFVLWGKNFHEVAATIFVTELRQAGLRVKVVGLDGTLPVGMNGLALAPDIPLSKALLFAGRTSCIIVPCPASRWPWLQQDPRLLELLLQSQQAGALLVIETNHREPEAEWAAVFAGVTAQGQQAPLVIKPYPPTETLSCFARQLAESLR
jgi:hypothetical protein